MSIMSTEKRNIDDILAPLARLSHIHGGNYFVQNGSHGLWPRGYWLIFESMYRMPGGSVFRGSQIHHSWAMQHAMQSRPFQMRKLSHYSLSYMIRGKGRYYDVNHPHGIALSSGDLICMFPGQEHVYAPDPGTRWDEININFTGEVFNSWVGLNLLDPTQPVRHLEPIDHWLNQIHNLVLPLAKPDRKPTITDTGKLVALISQMCEVWQKPMADAQAQWLEQAQQHLRDWPLREPLDLEHLAQYFSITQQTYRKKFKHLSGMTPTNFHARHVIEQACHRLRDTSVPLKQIADELGFGSEYYFSRRFKQIAGMPPGTYRDKSISS
jgi:AraC-like DNA-binding protein